ncbi:MAG: hypothetical protein P1U87_14525 [Verrucomicrobiales bacterium]|nr:hypothetical protein [Verrucomicrobiales bacterium]
MTTPAHDSKVITWSNHEGSGFLSFSEEEVIPVYAKDFQRFHRRPQEGDRVLHNLASGEGEWPHATDVVLLRARGLFHDLKGAWPTLFLVLPILAFLIAPLPGGFFHCVAYVFLLSAATFLLYHCHEFRRDGIGNCTPDSALHFLELLGGWPGAILAQHQIGTEFSRKRYQFFFWIIVGIWQGISIEAIFDWSVSQQLWGLFSPVLETVSGFA